MSSFWDRIFDQPTPEKNRSQMEAARRQMKAQQRRQYRARREAEKVAKSQEDQIRRLREDLEHTESEVDELEEALGRLVRCLIQNGVVEQADLDAMLPESTLQDGEMPAKPGGLALERPGPEPGATPPQPDLP